MNKKKFIGSFIGSALVIFLVIAFFIGVNKRKRLNSLLVKEEPIQQIISLTFNQRVAHMKKCFDAAEEITTLAWGESTGSITIQLYLDTIDDLKERKKLHLDTYLKSIRKEINK